MVKAIHGFMEIGLKPTFLLCNKLFISQIHRLLKSQDGRTIISVAQTLLSMSGPISMQCVWGNLKGLQTNDGIVPFPSFFFLILLPSTYIAFPSLIDWSGQVLGLLRKKLVACACH